MISHVKQVKTQALITKEKSKKGKQVKQKHNKLL